MDDETISQQLTARDALLAAAADRARGYLDTLATRPVKPGREAIAALSRFDPTVPEAGRSAEEILALLDEVGSPATIATAGPRYFGFVTGGALPIAVAASWLFAAWDQNIALGVMSPTGAHLDALALWWVVELLGLPAGTGGGFVTGASMANSTCLAAARDFVLQASGWDAAGMGLVGAPPIQVLAGVEAHTTVHKALGLVGLGRDRVLRLPVDEQGRILVRDLPRLATPAILCLQAGNVNSGASDPFEELIEWAHAAGAWVHVDGAFGLWAAASPELAAQVTGVQHADSWATDAHKWLNTTYDCGIALVARPEALAAAMQANAAYLPAGEQRDPMRYTPQTSQRARGAEVWAVLSLLGREGLAELVAGSCRHARRFAAALSAAGYEVLNEVQLNQVVVDFGGEEATAAVIAGIQVDGTCWCGPTHWRGRAAMRISASCWATSTVDVEASIAAMLEVARLARTATANRRS